MLTNEVEKAIEWLSKETSGATSLRRIPTEFHEPIKKLIQSYQDLQRENANYKVAIKDLTQASLDCVEDKSKLQELRVNLERENAELKVEMRTLRMQLYVAERSRTEAGDRSDW